MSSSVASTSLGITLILTLAAPISLAASDGSKEHERMVFTFDDPQDTESWIAVNDDVMGGISDGRARITGGGTLEFVGSVSLENNGGFASIRSRRSDVDLSSFDGLLVRVRGDGKLYDLNLRTNVRIMAGSYRAKFETQVDAWQEIYLPFADFEPTSFGRVRKDLPPLDPAMIRSFGLLISDKQAGAFKLEVEWIKAVVSPGQPGAERDAAIPSNRHVAIRHWIEAAISRGAPLYNAGQPQACAELYMLTVRSLLCLAPEELPPHAVERLAAALKEAEEPAESGERAWILRRALDFTLDSLAERAVERRHAAAESAG